VLVKLPGIKWQIPLEHPNKSGKSFFIELFMLITYYKQNISNTEVKVGGRMNRPSFRVGSGELVGVL